LKNLTKIVTELVSTFGPAKIKVVINKVIEHLVKDYKLENYKTQSNIRRRIYDAVNVLVASGILAK